MNKQQAPVRIENWCVTPLGRSPYTPPECEAHGLGGNVYGHPDFEDGASVTTTEGVSVRVEGDNAIVTTRSGREYLLGQIDPEYERQFPNARSRLIKSFGGAAISAATGQPS
jgi:hypothetical protein